MSRKPYVIDNMISAKSIAARIEQLAAEIEQEFADTDKLVVVGLLRGSFVFIADLVREINLPIEVDFLEVSSYDDAMKLWRVQKPLVDKKLAEQGMLFVGLDVIGGYVTEINVTSPTGIRELDKQFGIDIAALLIAAIRRRLESR